MQVSQVERDRLHRLVDELPDREVLAAQRYLEFLRGHARDAVLEAFLIAPEEHEPLSPGDEAAIDEAHAAVARGEIESWETTRAELFGRA